VRVRSFSAGLLIFFVFVAVAGMVLSCPWVLARRELSVI